MSWFFSPELYATLALTKNVHYIFEHRKLFLHLYQSGVAIMLDMRKIIYRGGKPENTFDNLRNLGRKNGLRYEKALNNNEIILKYWNA